MLRRISLMVDDGWGHSINIDKYEDKTGKLFHDDQGQRPLQPGDVVSYGYSSKHGEFGRYDYATGQHTADRKDGE